MLSLNDQPTSAAFYIITLVTCAVRWRLYASPNPAIIRPTPALLCQRRRLIGPHGHAFDPCRGSDIAIASNADLINRSSLAIVTWSFVVYMRKQDSSLPLMNNSWYLGKLKRVINCATRTNLPIASRFNSLECNGNYSVPHRLCGHEIFDETFQNSKQGHHRWMSLLLQLSTANWNARDKKQQIL